MLRIPQLILPSAARASCYANLHAGSGYFINLRRACMINNVNVRTYAKAKELTLPALSPTMEEGVVVSWSKKEGDKFKAGDVLFQLQTDKSVLDVEAQDDGVLAKIVTKGGSPPMPVGATIGFLAEPGDDIAKLEYPAASKPAAKPAPAKEAPKETPPAAQSKPSTPPPQQQQQQSAPSKPSPQQSSQPKQDDKHHDEDLLPSVRRLLLENNLDASQIGRGSGLHGKLLKEDVLNALKNKTDLPAASKAEATTSKPAPAKTPSTQKFEDIPNNNIRVVIAKRLTESKTKTPHLYVNAECNIDKLLAMRSRLNSAQKVKLSVNDFILKAAALTLRDIPAANAQWNNDSIRRLKDVDVSVAVATEKGLITPIVKNTDKKGLATIATELKDLATRARTGSLKPQEFQGGSFSVSNLGMYGISHFIAVINPPQAAILAIGAGRQEVQLPAFDIENPPLPLPAPPTPKVVNVVDVTLSCDARVIDEALAAEFLRKFQEYMANPEMLVL